MTPTEAPSGSSYQNLHEWEIHEVRPHHDEFMRPPITPRRGLLIAATALPRNFRAVMMSG